MGDYPIRFEHGRYVIQPLIYRSSFYKEVRFTAAMSMWPQHRQVKVSVKLDSSKKEMRFGCSQSKRKDWRLQISPMQDGKSMKIMLHHSPIHQTRIKEVTIILDIDEHVIKKPLDLKLNLDNDTQWLVVYNEKMAILEDKQNFSLFVKYEVDKDTGSAVCICSACQVDRFLPGKPPLSPLITLGNDFRRLFLSELFSDVVFAIGEEKIPAHKVVLATRLPYFERLFASGKFM